MSNRTKAILLYTACVTAATAVAYWTVTDPPHPTWNEASGILSGLYWLTAVRTALRNPIPDRDNWESRAVQCALWPFWLTWRAANRALRHHREDGAG